MTITELKNKVGIAIKGIDNATSKIIKEKEEDILDYVRINQLSKGKDADNKPISNGARHTGVYAYTYSKDDLGGWGDNSRPITTKSVGNPYNFTWSGYTMAHFDTRYSNFNLFILNTGSSAPYLTSFYDNGERLFEMSNENQEKMRSDIIIPGLFKYLQSIFR